MRQCYLLIVTLFAGLFTSVAVADGLQINPGLWEKKITTTNNMMGTTSTKTVQECIKYNEFDPVDDIQNDDCTTEKNISDNVMKYEISCNMHGRVIEGDGVVTVEGNTITDDRLIQNGAPGGVTRKTELKRIGDC